MKLISIYESLIQESGYGNIKSLTEKYFNECMNKYFSEYKKYMGEWEIPIFKVRSGTATAGLYSYIPTKTNLLNQAITMNPDIAANGDDMVRRVAFHETIHYVQMNLAVRRLDPYPDRKVTNNGHDGFFHEMMGKINSKEGSNYITVKQDSSEIQVSNKEFYVYGFETNTGQFGSMWSPTEAPALKNWLETTAKAKHKNIFWFKTDDYYFKESKSKFKGNSLKFVGIDKPDKIDLCKKNFQ